MDELPLARCDFCGKPFDARKEYWLTLRPRYSSFMTLTPEKLEVEFPTANICKTVCPWCKDKLFFEIECIFNKPKEE